MKKTKLIIFIVFLCSAFAYAQTDFTILPKNNTVFSDTIIEFDWNNLGIDFNYNLQISIHNDFSDLIINSSVSATTINVSNLQYDKKHYWTVIADNSIEQVNSDTQTFIISSIDNLPNINLWLSASEGVVTDIDNNVLYWQNLVDKTDSVFQEDISKQPDLIDSDTLVNNQSVVSFNGSSDQLVNFNYHKFGGMFIISRWNGDEEVFPTYNGMVARYSSADFPYLFIGEQNKSSILASSNPWGASRIYINQQNTLSFSPLNQYKIIYGQANTPANYNDLLVGSGIINNFYWKGEIAEIIAFDTIPADSVKSIVYKYLQHKYTPPVNLGEDIIVYGFCDTAITTAYNPRFTSYDWSTGSADSIIRINQDGKYSVTVTDIFGNISSDSINVSFPEIYHIVDTTICLGDSIIWDTGLGDNYTYSWLGNSSNDSAIYISSPGNYAVEIIDTNGCNLLSDTITVVVDSFPVKNSLGVDRSVCQGEAITLTENSGDVTNWYWSTESTAEYININTAGEYSVLVNNSRGCILKDTVNYSLSGFSPIVDFEADTVCFLDSTSFINLSSISGSDFIESYSWSFGNDSTSFLENPKHQYQIADTFVVTLSAIANTGCSNFYIGSVIIKERPIAGFEILYGNTHCTGSNVQFIDTSIANVTITNFLWDFDNTNTSIQQNPTHQFQTSDNYNIKLRTTAINGCADSITQNLEVMDGYPAPRQVSLISPVDNYFIPKATTIDFNWSAALNTIYYSFELAADSSFTEMVKKEHQINETNYSWLLSGEGEYYWRITAFNICGDSTISGYRSIKFSNIDNLPNINLWLSASEGVVTDIDNKVLYWQNLVDKTDSVFQEDISKQPMLISSDTLINNQPTIYFNGSSDQLINYNYHKFGGMYVVSRWDGAEEVFPTYNGMVARYSSGDFKYLFIGNSGTSNILLSATYTPWNATDVYINHKQTLDYSPLNQYKIIYGETEVLVNFNDLLVGSAVGNNYYWKGEITEIIAFDTIPTDSVKEIIYSYLQSKYSPPVNLGEDLEPYGFGNISISSYQPWFTSYLWSTNSTDSTITVSLPGTYHVTVTDIFGFESSDSIKVRYPEIATIQDTTICYGDTLYWDTKLKGDYTYEWNDVASGSSILAITNPGEYYLKVIDNVGYYKLTDTITVQVDSFPYYATLGPDTSLCSGNKLYLKQEKENAKAYLWQDGSTEQFFVVENSGDYYVTVTNLIGCIKEDTISVDINGIAPQTGFYFDKYCVFEEIEFYDTSKTLDGSELIGWEWFVNNQSVSTENDLKYQFNNSGEFTVKLLVSADNSCKAFEEKIIEVQPLPIPDFTPDLGCSYQDIIFNNRSIVGNSSIISSRWQLPEDSIINTTNAVYQFNESGNYNIQLIVESAFGCIDSLQKIIEIKPGPDVDFIVSPACLGEPVSFINKTEVFLGLSTDYQWLFGDDNSSGIANPTHFYNSAGLFNVTLVVYQPSNGCIDSLTKELTISPKPQAGFENFEECMLIPVFLSDTSLSSDENIISWIWEIENYGIITEHSSEIVFSDTGNFITKLYIETVSGCKDTAIGTITIHELPEANFTLFPEEGIRPLYVETTNSSVNGTYYNWGFGDGTVSNDLNPTHIYQDSGNYNIELKILNEYGCVDSLIKSVNVIIPDYDIAVLSVSAEIINDYLEVEAQLVNLGTYYLDSLTLYLTSEKGYSLKEMWTGILGSGQVITYKFRTSPQLQTGFLPSHVCVKAELSGEIAEDNYQNNESCFAFEDSFIIDEPFPNPSDDQVIIGFVLPFVENVKVMLYNSQGSIIETLYDGAANKGYNRIAYDISKLDPGIYTYQIIFNNKISTKRIMKAY